MFHIDLKYDQDSAYNSSISTIVYLNRLQQNLNVSIYTFNSSLPAQKYRNSISVKLKLCGIEFLFEFTGFS